MSISAGAGPPRRLWLKLLLRWAVALALLGTLFALVPLREIVADDQLPSCAFMTLVDPQQRARLRVPCHQADHGYRSEHDREIGLMVLAEEGHAARDDRGELTDIAPSVLQLRDRTPLATMRGQELFQPRRVRAAIETAAASARA